MLDLLCGIVTFGLARQAYSIEILCNSLKSLTISLVPSTTTDHRRCMPAARFRRLRGFNYYLWTCIHRVGRTGRAGARGFASTLVSGAEVSEFRRIERALRLRIKRKKTEYNHLVRQWRCRENNLPSRTLHSDAGRGIHNSHCFGAIGVALSRGNI